MQNDSIFTAFMIRILMLQSAGFQTIVEDDVGNLKQITVYRYVRSTGHMALRVVVYTSLADLPAAYANVIDDFDKIIEKFMSRDDVRAAAGWIPASIVQEATASGCSTIRELIHEINQIELRKLK